MNTPIHILNQLGILTSFSVAKKITDKDINNFFSKHKKKGKSDTQIGEMLREKIVADIQDAVEQNKVPGIVSQTEIAEELGIDKKVIEKIPEITRLVAILSQKILEKNYDVMTQCYFINSLVNTLGLTEDDFNKFHQQNNTDEDQNETGNDEFPSEE